MPRFHIVDIDQIELERAGYHIHATRGVEYVCAIKKIDTHAIIWDHDPAFAEILSRCPVPTLDDAGGST